MAITLKARRASGDQFTSEDNLEIAFDYSDVGLMQECFTTIEQVSGVTVTHGGGAPAGQYLHNKAYDLHGDEDGYIDYSTIPLQVYQTEKGTSVIKVKVQYFTKAAYDTWVTATGVWEDAYVTETVLKDGTTMYTQPDDAPMPPGYTYEFLTTGEITLSWADDTFV